MLYLSVVQDMADLTAADPLPWLGNLSATEPHILNPLPAKDFWSPAASHCAHQSSLDMGRELLSTVLCEVNYIGTQQVPDLLLPPAAPIRQARSL